MLIFAFLNCNLKTSEPNNSISQNDKRFSKAVDIYQKKNNEIIYRQGQLDIIDSKPDWYRSYKKLIEQYSLWCDPPETIYDCFTDAEINLICKTVETECYQQDFLSKCNVASVIFNRLYDGNFGESIKEIVTSENQFAYWRDIVSEDTVLAVEYAFQIEDTTKGCVAFHSNDISPSFYGYMYSFTDLAGHHFYE